MLYHWATGDSWQLWSLNLALVTNIRHAATGMSIGGIFSTKNPSAATTKSARLESYSHSTGCKTKNDRHSHARFLPSCCERLHNLMNKPNFSRCSRRNENFTLHRNCQAKSVNSWIIGMGLMAVFFFLTERSSRLALTFGERLKC